MKKLVALAVLTMAAWAAFAGTASAWHVDSACVDGHWVVTNPNEDWATTLTVAPGGSAAPGDSVTVPDGVNKALYGWADSNEGGKLYRPEGCKPDETTTTTTEPETTTTEGPTTTMPDVTTTLPAPTTTVAPTTTEAVTTTSSQNSDTTTTAAVVQTTGGGGSGTPGAALPSTGPSDAVPFAAAGLAALCGGAALVFVARRRPVR